MLRSSFSFDFNSSPEARSAAQVARRLSEAGHQAVLAGGAVRDMLLGRLPKDFDIATEAHPEQVLRCFHVTRKVGIAFGVVLVSDFESTVEVATFRSDMEYIDGRRPESVVFTTAENDAQRRDFTINGLFYDLERGEVLDYVEGRSDLDAGIIRAIGHPTQRFSEDYLRMLRAVRFAVTLDFKIEAQTWEALKTHAPMLQHIAADRIHEELRRTFLQGRSDQALEYLMESGLLKTFMPEAKSGHWQVDAHGSNMETNPRGGDLGAILALVLAECSKDNCAKVAERLRCTNEEKQELIKLNKALPLLAGYAHLTMAQRKRLLRELRSEQVLFLAQRLNILLPQLGGIWKDLQRWSSEDFTPPWLLLGKDLLAQGLRPGPALGQWLFELEELALNGELNSREDCLREVARRLKG